MKRTKHAVEISERFRDLVEDAGDALPDEHYSELALLIEAGIDTALVEAMEEISNRLATLSQEIRHNAEFFEDTDVSKRQREPSTV